MKETVNNLFTTRYYYLLKCARNILKLIKRSDLAYELVNDCFMHIMENLDKENISTPIKEGKIEALAVNWMTMQIKWSNTKFKQAWVYPHKHHSSKPIEILEQYALEDEIVSEEEYLEEEQEQQDKLNHISYTLSNLSQEKKLLYHYVYDLGYNTSGKLSKFTGISRTSTNNGCHALIRDLKDDLTKDYKKNDII